MGQNTGGLEPIAFLEALHTAFPAFAKKCFSSYDSPIDKYLSGQTVSTLICEEEAWDKLPTEIVETFVNLNCHISSPTSHLLDGLLAGLTVAISKHGASLDRYASDTKTGRITRLPRYPTSLFARLHRNRKINKKVKCNRKVIFPFELDATEFCVEVLRHTLSPTSNGLRDLREDAEDLNRTGGHLGNRKWVAANHAYAARRMAPASESGLASSPLAGQAEGKEKGGAEAKSKEAQANIGDREQELIDELDPSISQDEGCNLSGQYELMGVITHQGTGNHPLISMYRAVQLAAAPVEIRN
ncbi:hypothetical protein HOY80DRAFT_1098165 [Tuber brumale]|nr:hypothetical protein HOY80DRAFT_1098165 [Tuber brumale]